MIVYLIAAIAAIGALGGLYWKVDHNGLERGRQEVQVKWDAANAAAQQAAAADKARQDALRQAQDKKATEALSNEKKRTASLWTSLEAHIRAAGTSVQCPMPVSLLDDWNRANAGPKGVSPGTVPADRARPATPR